MNDADIEVCGGVSKTMNRRGVGKRPDANNTLHTYELNCAILTDGFECELGQVVCSTAQSGSHTKDRAVVDDCAKLLCTHGWKHSLDAFYWTDQVGLD